ncbi:transporter [Salmonella enterica subsp. enterica serovar Choleraesuis]|nr:transporter [Salmonella enterica subsp. enterica serovar Choleraesuis]
MATTHSTPALRGPTVSDILRSPRLLTRESLAGIITALALIPEVISFSVIAGVDPKVSLVASVTLCLVMSLAGGRPAMVTAAAGSVALVIGPMVHVHGVAYILPAVILAGLIQIAFAAAGLTRMMRYIPRSVMQGFVNALGILIFWAQVPHIWGHNSIVWGLFALTLAIVLLLPRVMTSIPAPLVAIVVITVLAWALDLHIPVVNDAGAMQPGLPGINAFLVPLNLETLQIVWPCALSVALVGLMETLLTAKLVDDLTDTPSSKRRECLALGGANICAGFFGGIAGCAMIGQTMVNVELGQARSRVSTLVAGLVLLLMVTSLSAVMARIPMVVLAGIMIIVALKTLNWHSLSPSTLRRMPKSESAVMLLTVIATVVTGNLAIGVVGGVIFAIIMFARRVAHVINAERTLSDDGTTARYNVRGPLFFASSNDLFDRFAYADDPAHVIIDLSHAQIWDASSVAALDAIEERYHRHRVEVTVIGLDARSHDFHQRLSGRL